MSKTKYPVRHGHAKQGMVTPTWRCWANMLQRCSNPKRNDFKNYGGRGITVCSRWLKFDNFLSDMGEKPNSMTLHRIDNDGPYSPENCAWATHLIQNRNKRSNRVFHIAGLVGCMSELCEHFGISIQTVSSRIHRQGWPEDKAFLTPAWIQSERQPVPELRFLPVQIDLPIRLVVRRCRKLGTGSPEPSQS